jgi:DNA-binding IclR family transcriptional regulator
MKKKQKVVKALASGMEVIPHSGGESVQLKGFDGRERVVASPTGGTRTADILSRPGAHVPAEKSSTATPRDYHARNSGPQFRSGTKTKFKQWLKLK